MTRPAPKTSTASLECAAPCASWFDRSQYLDFHGREPGPGWVEAMPADVRAAANGRRPNIVFLSAPCKGFSGLPSETRSTIAKYQALNRLTLRGVWLMLEAWADDPPEVILFENVPRIATRGRHLFEQITGMLRHYGYVVREYTALRAGHVLGQAVVPNKCWPSALRPKRTFGSRHFYVRNE